MTWLGTSAPNMMILIYSKSRHSKGNLGPLDVGFGHQFRVSLLLHSLLLFDQMDISLDFFYRLDSMHIKLMDAG